MLPFFVMFGVEINPQCHISLQKCLRRWHRKKVVCLVIGNQYYDQDIFSLFQTRAEMDKGGGGLHSPLLLPICAKCNPRHNLWQLDTPVNTTNGQGGDSVVGTLQNYLQCWRRKMRGGNF